MTDKGTDKRFSDGNFFVIQNAVFQYDLTPYEGWLYCCVVMHVNQKTGTAWPSLNRLTKLSNMSKPKVIEAMKKLEEYGLIVVNRNKKKDGSNTVNHYALMPPSGKRDLLGGSKQDLLGVVNDVDSNNTIPNNTIEKTPDEASSSVNANGTNTNNAVAKEAFSVGDKVWLSHPYVGDGIPQKLKAKIFSVNKKYATVSYLNPNGDQITKTVDYSLLSPRTEHAPIDDYDDHIPDFKIGDKVYASDSARPAIVEKLHTGQLSNKIKVRFYGAGDVIRRNSYTPEKIRPRTIHAPIDDWKPTDKPKTCRLLSPSVKTPDGDDPKGRNPFLDVVARDLFGSSLDGLVLQRSQAGGRCRTILKALQPYDERLAIEIDELTRFFAWHQAQARKNGHAVALSPALVANSFDLYRQGHMTDGTPISSAPVSDEQLYNDDIRPSDEIVKRETQW